MKKSISLRLRVLASSFLCMSVVLQIVAICTPAWYIQEQSGKKYSTWSVGGVSYEAYKLIGSIFYSTVCNGTGPHAICETKTHLSRFQDNIDNVNTDKAGVFNAYYGFIKDAVQVCTVLQLTILSLIFTAINISKTPVMIHLRIAFLSAAALYIVLTSVGFLLDKLAWNEYEATDKGLRIGFTYSKLLYGLSGAFAIAALVLLLIIGNPERVKYDKTATHNSL